MKFTSPDQLFPVIYGNELETSSTLEVRQKVPYGDTEDLDVDSPLKDMPVEQTVYMMPKDSDHFIPDDLRSDTNTTDFLENGFRLYDGFMGNESGMVRVEIASPECSDVDEMVLYMRVGEKILERGAENQLTVNRIMRQESYDDDEILSVQLNKRITDTVGNTWGCHDNFGYTHDVYRIIESMIPSYLPYFLATRTFIGGAGLVHSEGDGRYSFSQKMGDVGVVSIYGQRSRMYRVDKSDDSVPRLEISCSDANISDWAARLRIGEVAILFALARAGLLGKLYQGINQSPGYSLGHALRINDIQVDSSGTIQINDEQRKAASFHRSIASLALNELPRVVAVPKQLLSIAAELGKYCDDFLSVADGDAPVQALMNRADWAMKLSIILARMERQKSAGGSPVLGDIDSVARDVIYDRTIIRPSTDPTKYFYEYGDGYEARKRGLFGYNVPEKLITRAYESAPATRASARAALLASGVIVIRADWSYVDLANTQITMPDPRSVAIPDRGIELINRHKKENANK